MTYQVYLSVALTVVYYLVYPIVRLLQWILIALSPLWYCLQFLLLPLTHLGHVFLDIFLFPFQFQLLKRIETIYIYLGIAGLIGFMTGGILYLCFNFLSSALNIDPAAEEAQAKWRTAASYRAARRRKKMQSLDHLLGPTMIKEEGVQPQKGLLSQTIIEEEDSDF
ncbi:hypothetical protein K432DRAFT_288118 [Lepidopterella palustris CBS 459.81]|uniref:Uncharacterized protein n=1 Tax=Lepidopterella palustris CBS 459.81 TaxID=1314670 RepID=A0A8E2EJ79_9PEZI|nr:hypothetical protein K432DRAFT_288118 [Lepidopterella palustris CBS 459.81]